MALPALMLSACNLLVSDEPVLEDSEDSAEPPEFRDGIWIIENDKCRINKANPVAEWPECADIIRVDGDTWSKPEWKDQPDAAGKRAIAGWTDQMTFVVGGNPLLMEVKVTGNDEATGEDYESPYLYLGLRPTASDKDGKLTAIRLWPARCGPVTNPSRRVSPDGKTVGSYVTARPFPGLSIESYYCKAENLDALKGAILSSEKLAGNVRRARWVRAWQDEMEGTQ